MSLNADTSEAGATNGSASSAVVALQRTHESLGAIRARLTPFLKLASSTDAEADERALAQAAIALSIATLRVVGHRLRGQDRGKAPDDPLRQELNRIRAALQEANAKCKAKQKEREEAAAESSIAAKTSANQPLASEASQQTSNLSNAAVNKRKEESLASDLGETNLQSAQDASPSSKKSRTR